MPAPKTPASSLKRTPIDQMKDLLTNGMTPVARGFFYHLTFPVSEDDLREFLFEPVNALPLAVCEAIAPVRVVLVPYLERDDARGVPAIVSEPPPIQKRLRSAYLVDDGATLFFSIRGEKPPEYHQIFFNTVAHLLSRRLEKAVQTRYSNLLLTEFEQHVHGEVDEASWHLKQNLPRTAKLDQPNTKTTAFRDYVGQSFADTMTLYMHGICCDIDVEKGPRQMPSRWLRKRLEALYEMFPPPNGRPVLPEHLARRQVG